MPDRIAQSCNVCGPTEATELLKVKDNAYQQCNRCGLIFSKWIAADYEAENEQAFEAELAAYAAKASNPKRTRRIKSELKKFEPYRQNNRFLELGCNTRCINYRAANGLAALRSGYRRGCHDLWSGTPSTTRTIPMTISM